MNKKQIKNNQPYSIRPLLRSQGRNLSIFILVVLIVLIVLIIWTKKDTKHGESGEGTPSKPTEDTKREKADMKKLIGQWQRTDGGYIIHIEKVEESGQLGAAYYNPRPINISKAEASYMRSNLEIFLELWDENYPGSTYKLTYDPAQDVLYGEYFTPVAGQTFDVYFVRIPE